MPTRKWMTPTAVLYGCGLLMLCSVTTSAEEIPKRSASEPVYEAVAMFRTRHSTPGTPILDAPLETIQARMAFMLNFQFRGRPAVEQLIIDLNLTRGFPITPDGELTTDGKVAHRELIEKLSNAITATVDGDDGRERLISVRVRHADRELARQIADQLVDNAIRKTRNEHDDRLLAERKFLNAEVDRYRRKITDLNSAKTRLAAEAGMPSLDDIKAAFDQRQQAHRKVDDDLATRRREAAIANVQLEKLAELNGTRPTSDAIIIEQARLHAIAEICRRDLAVLEKQQQANHEAQKNDRLLKIDLGKIERELESSKSNLRMWENKLNDNATLLALSFQADGNIIQWVQRAETPIKPVP